VRERRWARLAPQPAQRMKTRLMVTPLLRVLRVLL
jgi:hypothetical protein